MSTEYATLDEVRNELGITGSTDTTDDAGISRAIEAASRWIDEYCGRRFYTTSADETRYYAAEWPDLLVPDEIVSITTLGTDSDGDRTYEDTWASTDYDLLPANAALDGKPYTSIGATPAGRYVFPVGVPKGVKIVGKFGWSTAPMGVRRACVLLACRWFKRKDAIFGIMGASAFGQVLMQVHADPDVELMLMPYRRLSVGGI